MSEYMQNREGEESDNFFCRFSFGQFFALLVLEIFTLFFVFYLGARYGREFLGLEKAQAVAQDASQPAVESAEDGESKVLTTADPEAEKVARELIEKAKTPELKERITKMFDEAKGAGESPAAGGADVARVDTTQEEAATATETAAPPAEAEPKPAADDAVTKQMELLANAKNSSVIRVKSGDNSRYSLQIGSYQKLDEATESVEKWKDKGYSAYIMIADIPERGRWYRVRIGGFASRADAAKYLSEFKANENMEALIVFNEQ